MDINQKNIKGYHLCSISGAQDHRGALVDLKPPNILLDEVNNFYTRIVYGFEKL